MKSIPATFLNSFLSTATQGFTFLYPITLIVKMYGFNLKLLVHKLIFLILILNICQNVVATAYDVYQSNKLNTYTKEILDLSVSTIATIVTPAFAAILYLRNKILITGRVMRYINMVLFMLLIISALIGIPLAWIWSRKSSIAATLSTILAAEGVLISYIYDIMSAWYLLLYYKRYYFNSESVMKHLRFQMEYRRNWIRFVILIDILGLLLFIPWILNYFGGLIVIANGYQIITLLQLNTMIDFVKFDTVRNEITMNTETLYLYEDHESHHL